MASKIRIHRSTGAAAPSSLEFGELAATVEQGTAGNSGNKAGRLFIGNVAGNPVEIGGEYIYKLIDHTPGQVNVNSALIVDSNANLDGIRIAGISTITRTDITDAVTQNLNVTGVTTFASGVNLNGDVVIGNAITDLLTLNARTTVVTDLTLSDGLTVAGVTTTNAAIDANGTVDFGADVVFNSATNDITFDQSASKIQFKDNNKATFGNGDSIQIYHDASHGFINNTTGDLKITDTSGISLNTNAFKLYNGASDETLISADNGADVKLFHNNNNKLETTATGVTITGTPIISNLTATRVPFVGSSKELVDHANFTYGSNVLNVVGRVDATDLDAGANLRAVAGVVTTFTSTHNSSTHTVGTGATFTTSFHLGSGATNYTFPNARGANDQILILNGSGQFAFEDVPGTLVISAGYASTDAVELLPDVLTIAATDNETKTTLSNNTITVGLATDVRVGGGLTVANNCHIIGNLTVDGTETVLNTIRLDVQDNKVGVGSTSTASNTTADGCGYFVHGGSDGDKEILYLHAKTAFTSNQNLLPVADNGQDLGASDQEWKNLYIDGTAAIDTLQVHDGATVSAGADVTLTGSTSGENIVWDSSEGTLDIADDVALKIGDGDDLSISHGGTASNITNTTGYLFLESNQLALRSVSQENYLVGTLNSDVKIYHDSNEKLATTSTGINVTGVTVDDGATHDGDVTFTGTSKNVVWDKSDNALEFQDNAFARFGDTNDLEIYHNGSHSYIDRKTGGTGDIYVRLGTDNAIVAKTDNAVELYFDNVKKLATTTDGVTLNDKLLLDNATTAGRDVEWQHADDRLKFSDNTKATFGDGNDLEIIHNGTNSSIENDTGTLTVKNTVSGGYTYVHADKVHLRSQTGNESFLTSTHNGPVEIYYDNAEKLSTEAYGIDVTGTTQSDTLIVTGVSTVASMIFSAGTNTNGVAYFNAAGQVTSTINPTNSVTTSFKILTTDTNGVPTWTSTIDCGTF
tara:strand:+ start:8677 stop:11619 length:2943 start_codon:yes stop_codon:yes gene_type:complete